jgi:hypothetical protein
MGVGKDLTARGFCTIIVSLAQKSVSVPDFTGVGLILYDPDVFDRSQHTSLRPSTGLPCEASLLDTVRAVKVLLELSNKSNKMHDGFHFFNGVTGRLDYVSQYFVPRIVVELAMNEDYGTRYHSALYGSCIEGVILTGTVNYDNKPYIFKGGRLVREGLTWI